MRPVDAMQPGNWLWPGLAALCLWGTPARGDELVELVKKVEHSVVRIDTVADDSISFGSGVIIDKSGLILTNFHVVEGARKVTITLRSGDLLKAVGFLAADPKHDLAILKTSAVEPSKVISVATALPSIGERVAAFGSPKGFSFSTSDGIVSAIRNGSEIAESLGREAYAQSGYAVDATWIQTTAAISPGNSGGPLVTMKGQLVGLNTWGHNEGQNLNFAISLVDIQKALADTPADTVPRSFAELPRRATSVPEPPDPGRRRRRPGDFKVVLPTGRVFSYALFDIDESAIHQAAETSREDQVVIHHANGVMYAVAGQRGGQLHGLTVGQYENKERMVVVTYAEGKRHGVLATGDESGKAILFAQYLQGKHHGFTAWHEEGVLRLILQYKQDKLEWVQLMHGHSPLEGFESRELAEKNEEAKASFAKLDQFEADLKKNELAFRKQVKEFEMARRRASAAQLAPEKRRMQSARGAARAAAENAFLQELYRKAAGR